MTTISVDVMLSKPGIYVVVSGCGVGLAEVDAAGRCWSLNLTDYNRDNELRPGGWNLQALRAILGPFARASSGASLPSA